MEPIDDKLKYVGPYGDIASTLDVTYKELATNQGILKIHEHPTKFGDMILAFKNNDLVIREFKMLSEIANRMKPCILECQHLNIYGDIQPFESTAVLIRNDSN